MSEYDGYEDPAGHEDPATEYPVDEHAENPIAIGQSIFEATGHEAGAYADGGAEGGYADGGDPGAYAEDGGAEATGYAADTGDTAGGEYSEGTSTATIDDLTGDTVSYSGEPTDYTPPAR